MQATRLFDPQQVRELESDRLKRIVPLRKRCYQRLSTVLNTAQQKGLTVRDVLDDLSRESATSMEAALLFRDLWEVLRIVESRRRAKLPEFAGVMAKLVEKVEMAPFGGEEVLF